MKNLVDSYTDRLPTANMVKGNPAWSDHVYNQATFIGASLLLYKATGEKTYLDNAILGADYTMNTMSGTYLPAVREGVEQGIYTAIFAEYMAMLVNDCPDPYVPFWNVTLITAGLIATRHVICVVANIIRHR